MTKQSKIILSIIAVIAVFGIVLVAYMNSSGVSKSPTAVAAKLVKSDSHTLGTGKVQVVEFGDYQCPACGQAYPITKQILSEYGDKITFVFRNFPLPQLHPNAEAGAEAAEAANAQGKFWEMHDMLYENQDSWSDVSDPTDIFVSYASTLGLDTAKFKKDITSKAYDKYIQSDVSDGYSLGITGTPTFYINGKQQASYDYNTLKSAIQAALK